MNSYSLGWITATGITAANSAAATAVAVVVLKTSIREEEEEVVVAVTIATDRVMRLKVTSVLDSMMKTPPEARVLPSVSPSACSLADADHLPVSWEEEVAAKAKRLADRREALRVLEADLAERKKRLNRFGIKTEPCIDLNTVDFDRMYAVIEREDALARGSALKTEEYEKPVQEIAVAQLKQCEEITPSIKRETSKGESGHVLDPGALVYQPSKAEDTSMPSSVMSATTIKTEEDPVKIKAK